MNYDKVHDTQIANMSNIDFFVKFKISLIDISFKNGQKWLKNIVYQI